MLKLLPVQVIELQRSVIIRRGVDALEIKGASAIRIVQGLVSLLMEAPVLRQELVSTFATSDQPFIDQLIDRLISKRLILSDTSDSNIAPPGSDETSLDLFYWNFNAHAAQISERVAGKKIVVFGVNAVSRELLNCLKQSGFRGIGVVDYPLLRNLRMFDDSGIVTDTSWKEDPISSYAQWSSSNKSDFDCLVGCSDFGGREMMQPLNQFCVQSRRVFLPVVLQDLKGYVGPIVVPGETPCYECARARENANNDDFESLRAIEGKAFEGQDVTGFHPSMAAILGDIAGLEILKFYCRSLPNLRVGNMILADFLVPEVRSARVLKIPRCPVCSPLFSHAAINIFRDLSGDANL